MTPLRSEDIARLGEIRRNLNSWFPHSLFAGISALAQLSFESGWSLMPRVLELRAHRFGAVRKQAQLAVSSFVKANFSLVAARAEITQPLSSTAVQAFALLGGALSVAHDSSDWKTMSAISQLLAKGLAQAVGYREDPYLMESPPAPIKNVLDAIGESPEFGIDFVAANFAHATEAEATALLSLIWKLKAVDEPRIKRSGLHHPVLSVAKKFSDLASRMKCVSTADIEELVGSSQPTSRAIGYDLLGEESFRDTAVSYIVPAVRDLVFADGEIQLEACALIISLWGRLIGEDEWGRSLSPLWLNPAWLNNRAGILSPGMRPEKPLIKYRIPLSQQLGILDKMLAADAVGISTLLLENFDRLGGSRAEGESPKRASQLAALWVGSRIINLSSRVSGTGVALPEAVQTAWENLLSFWALSADTPAERNLASTNGTALGFVTCRAA